MKTRAAVAWKAGAPLTIETVDLEGPRAGEIAIDDLITHRLKLDDINRGFELMKSGESIRSVVVY